MDDYYKYEHDFEEQAALSNYSYISDLPQSRLKPDGSYDIEAKEMRTSKRLKRMKEDECITCMEPLGKDLLTGIDGAAREFVKTPCGHKFHKECLLEWLNQKHQCPVCRRVIPDYQDDY
jgi:hypothetical protein